MSLDVYLTAVRPTEVYSRNITHNLNKMAMEADIYMALWRPGELGIEFAHQLILPLTKGLEVLKNHPEDLRKFNPENGYGTYEGLVEFVEDYLAACVGNPDAEVRACR